MILRPYLSVALYLLTTSSAQAFILNGTAVQAQDLEARSTVAIYDGNDICTGTLFARDLVITAAHCLTADPTQIFVVFALDLDQATHADVRAIVGYEIPKEWKGDQSRGIDQSDIAILRFSGELPEGYEPATLLTQPADLNAGDSIQIAGFGVSDAMNEVGEGRLRKSDLTIANPHHGHSEVLIDQTAGNGACHGDSGGPASQVRAGTRYVWGIANRTYPEGETDECQSFSVYTRISAFSTWITGASATLRALP